MLTVLNFCGKDRELAFKLLKWIQDLGGAKNHELLLVTGVQTAAAGMHAELELLAHETFGKAQFRVTDTQDEGGWPSSPNNAWRDTIIFTRMKVGHPFLWLEPDCTPITSDWLDRIEAEFIASGKPFLGAEVTKPQHRMSGVGVYPPDFVSHTSRLHMLPKNVPFDQYFASDIVPKAHFTTLIQNVWNTEFGKPETIPTFPTKESLSLLDPKAVLFHRCKDGTLIDRLRENRVVPVVVQPKDETDPLVAQNEALARQNEELMKRLRAFETRRAELDYCGLVGGIEKPIQYTKPTSLPVSAIHENEKERISKMEEMMSEKRKRELDSGIPYTPEQEEDLMRRIREVLDGKTEDAPTPSKDPKSPRKQGVPMKQKRQFSEEQKQAMRERLAKAREAKTKKKLTGVV